MFIHIFITYIHTYWTQILGKNILYFKIFPRKALSESCSNSFERFQTFRHLSVIFGKRTSYDNFLPQLCIDTSKPPSFIVCMQNLALKHLCISNILHKFKDILAENLITKHMLLGDHSRLRCTFCVPNKSLFEEPHDVLLGINHLKYF